MPVKLFLADKSITIQKVVEMLFSGREYDVACVSDGDAALREAERIVPDVVLADVDLPRIDGYSLALQLKKNPKLAAIPVILMMSRDDVYDTAKGKQSGITDKIVKPFESQELIGKVKKALASAPPRSAEPARPEPTRPAAAAPLRPPQPAATPKKQAPPADIFDIISDAPTPAELKQPHSPAEEESVYEVEPVVEEIEAPFVPEEEKALPTGAKAVEEMRAGLGLIMESDEAQPEIISFESFDAALQTEQSSVPPKPPFSTPAAPPAEQSEIVTFSSLDMAREAEQMFVPQKQEPERSPAKGAVAEPVQQPTLPTAELRSIVEETVSRMAAEAFRNVQPPAPPQIPAEMIRSMATETISRMAAETFKNMPPPVPPQLPAETLRTMAAETLSRMAADVIKDMGPPPLPKISDETIRRGIQDAIAASAREIAREVIEQVAWEVIPQLAEHLIKEEIERLKSEMDK